MALQALVDCGDRYKAALGSRGADLKVPRAVGDLIVVDRYAGDATTDFGAPGAIPATDRVPVSATELDRLIGLLEAAWQAFEAAANSAAGMELRPAGPRGGGRELGKIREHVSGADGSYARAVGGTSPPDDDWPAVQRALLEHIRARARGELPDRGPRGGERWPARYGIRRSAWHALDHAWEIEDRLTSGR